jgi:hypothetical protein
MPHAPTAAVGDGAPGRLPPPSVHYAESRSEGTPPALALREPAAARAPPGPLHPPSPPALA